MRTDLRGHQQAFHRGILEIDCASAVAKIQDGVRAALSKELARRGLIVGVSGGVDSAVCASLAVAAVGKGRVFGLLMPERDSAEDSTVRGRAHCEALGIAYALEDIAPMLHAAGCYRRRDEAVRRLFPEFGAGHRMKITVADALLDEDRLNYFNLVVASPDGREQRQRMPLDVYLQVVAATNMKQRTRKMLEYYHADRLNYAVLGTPNRLEYELGFFVRGGDGLADIKPIAHLYKTQVYALARHLGVSEEIWKLPPSTDTYSLPQTQEEFYYALPYDLMDLLLYAYTHRVPAHDAGCALDLTETQVERAYRDIEAKQRTAKRLLRHAALVDGSVSADL